MQCSEQNNLYCISIWLRLKQTNTQIVPKYRSKLLSSKSRAALGWDLDLDLRFQLDVNGIVQIHTIDF